MNTEITQERNNHLSWIENHLRLAGQKLDMLWMEARSATGQAKADIHNQIGPLREKQRAEREEQVALKNGGDIAGMGEKSDNKVAAVRSESDFRLDSSTRT